MKKVMTVMAVILALTMVASDGWAQMRRGRGSGDGPQVDLNAPVTLHGEVVNFGAGFGARAAVLTVLAAGEEYKLMLGPVWNIQDQGFVAEAGDSVVVQGFSCGDCRGKLAVASVENLTRGLTLNLRGEDGLPLWQGERGARHAKGRGRHQGGGEEGVGAGRRPGTGHGPGPEMGETAVYLGTVQSFSGAPGEGVPTLVLATAAGDVTIVVGPHRRLTRSGFEITPGMDLEVTAASAGCPDKGHLVAVALKNPATGVEIALRGTSQGAMQRRGGRR